jgi:signal transduction histidine kinase
MAAQIQELLDVASLQAGQPLNLKFDAVDLMKLTRRVIDEYLESTRQHHIHLETQEAQLLCMGDEMRLDRVVTNLISNAIKYSPNGGSINVTVTRSIWDDNQYAILSVADQGIGIPAADMPRLFTPFQRGSNVIGQIRGTGLGLASVRDIIEQHGGQITVESEEGRGSTFTLWLPLADI